MSALEERDEYYILTESGPYRQKPYKNEQELERLAVSHAKELFGEDTLYLDLKVKVMGGKLRPRITDGLLLDFRDRKRPKFWIVEYELSSHDMEGVVIPQLRGFVTGFKTEETRTETTQAIYNEIQSNPEKLRRFKELAGDNSEVYLTINRAVHETPQLLVVFDALSQGIADAIDGSDLAEQTLLKEFTTFERDGTLVHSCNPLLPYTKGDRGQGVGVARVRRAGSLLDQVLEVAVAMRNGESWNRACRQVASKRGITHNSVMSATTRGLKLRGGKAEFESVLREGKLPSLLINRFSEARDRIESLLQESTQQSPS